MFCMEGFEIFPLASRSNAAPGFFTWSSIPSATRTKTPEFDLASLLLKTMRIWQLSRGGPP